MEFGPLDTFKIEKPPVRLDLWPDPVATHNLGGDHWCTIRDLTMGFGFDDLQFALKIPRGFLVDVTKLPATMRWFIRPNSLAGRVLVAFQWLKENQLVYDTSGVPVKLTRRKIIGVIAALLTELRVPSKHQTLILMQLIICERGTYYTNDHDARKLTVEVHNQEKALLKEAQKNDRAKRHP